MRPVTHRRMFFSFSFMQVSSQEPFHYETSLPPLFQRFLIFSSGCKITLNFSVVFQLTYHSPEPSEQPDDHFLFPYAAFLFLLLFFILRLDDSSQIFTLLTAPYPHPTPTSLLTQQASADDSAHSERTQKPAERTSSISSHLQQTECLCPHNAFLLLLFSPSVMSNSLRRHELQHARLPCPSLYLLEFAQTHVH